MKDSAFDILGLCPADLPQAGIALAVARAGGLGLLDLEFATDAARIERNFERLLGATSGRLGLRVTAASADLASRLVERAGERTLSFVLAGAVNTLAALRLSAGVRETDLCLAEILSADDLSTAVQFADGVVARGHEAGGWVGEDSSFILLQKLRGQTAKPVFIQGGIGVRAAAASRAAGAAGVVLDDCMLLLAESSVPAAIQADIARLNGAECKLLGELLQRPCRAFARPASAALKSAEEDTRAAEGESLSLADWAGRMNSRLGWQADRLLPLGQSVGLAAAYRDSYRSVGRLVQAVRRASLKQVERAAQLGFIDENGPLARSHGTRYPLAQGPMTRVSDSPAFAAEVARNGALPFLALALMRGPQVADMLTRTQELAGALPWGVGMLGFVPQALREEQCAEIWKCKPAYALIAGGRPDQAAEFEKRGIATYIHAPAPALLKLYLEQGARRFVFEGRECGGHVGPLGSFPLWEQMIEVLLAQVPAGEEKNIHVLLAGGIHDAASSAIVATMTAPLAERGMKVGCLMGTAYLFTQEIVESGAVVEGFQAEALRCERTMNLESGPGHASRCVDTKFAHDFYDTRRRLIREGKSTEEIRDVLEDLNLGRLRIASKGVNRDDTGRVVEVPVEQQLADGMYMIGQVATMRDRVQSLAELHENVTRGAQALLDEQTLARIERAEDAKPSDIAIVGIGITLPKADSADDYWKLILDKHCVIREVPKDRWDTELYYDADQKSRDKIYSKWGGFLDEIPFDPMRFGIPPKSMKSIDPLQLLTLETAARTLADAGYADGQFDRENTSVILGAGGGAGDLGVQYSMRSELPRFVENLSPEVWERLPEWTEESFAGTLLNVAAGRVANRLDFGGVNFTVDAACGSSLAAISIAVHELETGRSSMVLAGGFDTTQSAFAFTAFAKTQALSAKGQARTFDQSADGIAISEGVAMVALKRLADAERDGDRIYAVIKAASGSSDGKALGLTAPRTEGQVRALKRAYRKAGFSTATLGLVEAHGTGTPVGDRTEAQTIARALNEDHAVPRSVAIGSVKTLIGHTKAAAGVAGLIKVALSLYHRVLPAHYGVDKPIDTVADAHSPVYLLKDARPWVASPQHPRRGAASAFGFGGTNFHAVLEEYNGAASGARGGNRWPAELFLFRAADVASLAHELEKILPHLQPGSRIKPAEFAAALARQAGLRRAMPVALAIVAGDLKSLAQDLAAAVAHLQGGTKPLPASIKLNKNVPATSPAVAFLFPGQGSQYLNMGREAALYLPEVREALEFADGVLAEEFRSPLSSLMLPHACFDAEAEAAQNSALTDTRVAQPAIGTMALGYLRLAERLGIEPVAAAGHSYGEYSALMAAGALSAEDFLRLSAARGRAMAAASKSSQPGGMAAVQGMRERIAALVLGFDGVRIANHNAPEQSVISGPKDQIEKAVQKLGAEGLRASLLPVSGAFHTELVAPAKTPLSAAIHATEFKTARFPVYANTSGAAYPAAPEAMQNLLDGHLLSSVEFVTEIEAMYAAGCRVFLELGPKGVCAGMARQTLAGRDAAAISLDANGGGLRGLLIGLGELFVNGVDFDIAALFAEREIHRLEMTQLAELGQPVTYPKHWWMVSGGCARAIDDPVQRTGAKPALTKATSDAARAAIEQRMSAQIKAKLPVQTASSSPSAGISPALALAPAALNSEAWQAYQQTMRQFLALQERVVQQYMSGASLPVDAAPTLTLPMQPSVPAAARVIDVVPAQTPVRSAPAASRDLRALLLGIVSERTGYPSEMLELDADLEADLGIDSIKRVEILGALQNALPSAEGQVMHSRMERLTRSRSLNAWLSELGNMLGAEPGASSPAAAAVAAMIAVPASLDAQPLLLGIVSERTGYPSEMLGLDADLEADLGIDSIKRVEILGALQKALPAQAGAAMQLRMERFTKARSLNLILAELSTLMPALPALVAQALSRVGEALDFKALMLGIVSERTGYPSEMLGLDADLEADLGIDSIKRVEILGALQKALPTDIGATVQSRMERFTKARSLSLILAELNGLQPAPVQTASPVALSAMSFDVQSLLLGIVAERTGYPVEMLGLDADLEADLGIDSIKRVEILGALQKALPADVAAQIQSRMERYTKARSLALMLTELAAAQSENPAPAAESEPAPAQAPAPADVAVALPRFVIKTRPAPLSGAVVALEGPVLVLGGPASVTQPLLSELEARGLAPLHIADADAENLRKRIVKARKQRGAFSAILHLHGLSIGEAQDLSTWRALYQRDLLSLFHAIQVCIDDLPKARVIGASRLGGTFGRDAVGKGEAIAGGVNGMLNCLRNEYPSCQARAVDFDGQSDAEIAELLVQELFAQDSETEAGYIVGRERYGASTVEQALVPSPFPAQVTPSGEWVLLATGGARGITAEIIEELVRPGMRVVLLGRTVEPAPEDPTLAQLADAGALRKAVLAQRLARGEKPRPVEVDREVARVLVDREIRGNLARLRAAGASVDYVPCDVRDETALGGLIDALYARHGRIDAVIHGAGVIEDKLLADKSAESFERVLGTKLDPAFVFSRKLRGDTLKLLCFFTSVAGRYGNRGQTDYAAANEALNRCAWMLHRRFAQTRVMAINWGPWDGGMASEGVKRALRERGMEPIPVAAGRRMFADELAQGLRNDVELVAGKGPWAELDAGRAPVAATSRPGFAFVRREPRVGLGGAMMLEHRLSLADDPYMADYLVDGAPQLPLAVALEYLSQFAAAGWPQWQVAEIRDLRLLSPLSMDTEAGRDLVLRARAATHSEPGAQAVTVEMLDPRRKDSAMVRATAVLLPELPLAPAPSLARLMSGQSLEAASAYAQHLRRGDRFRCLSRIMRVDHQGVDADLLASSPQLLLGDSARSSSWLFDPTVVDAASQLAFVWARIHREKGTQPARLGRIRRFGFGPMSGGLHLSQRVQPTDGERGLRYSAEVVDASGQVRLLIEDGESSMLAELNRLAPSQQN
ncbi:MAG: SDR family NAD(P)-dependent oxidoreductase [Panacagrimonas sp.]